jgi:penicillin-binding protein 2
LIDKELHYRRVLILFGILLFIFAGLFVRLLIIQLAHYPKYSKLAAVQRQGSLLKNTLKGSFFDRHGLLIRGSSEAWYLLIEKTVPTRGKMICDRLRPIMAENFEKSYDQNKSQSFWIFPIPLNNSQIVQIRALRFSECKIVAATARQDQYQGIAWHILGLNDKERGLSGLEHLYQKFLQGAGNNGSIFTLNDGEKGYFPGLGLRSQSNPNLSGVVLTIDAKIQQIVEQVMVSHGVTGAIVILDAQTGQILAMCSRPQVGSLDRDAMEKHPYLNRAISAYHPGSIFKLVALSAGLDSGLLSPDDYFEDRGFYRIGDKLWRCTTSKGGHGVISLKEALAYSCNPIFIQVALRLRPQLILDYADRFGLGQPANIGLRDESWGKLPSGIGFSDGDIANLVLGQQDVYTTPLQIASLIQTIANDGVRCVPQLVLGTVLKKGAAFKPLIPKPMERVIKSETAGMIRDMMTAVVTFGTGKLAQLPGGAAGKTGTAQVNDEADAPSHAWFGGYTPINHPKYVGVIFCEQGISGAETAAPLFKEVMEKVTRIED